MWGKSRVASRYWVINWLCRTEFEIILVKTDEYSKDNLLSVDKKRGHCLHFMVCISTFAW